MSNVETDHKDETESKEASSSKPIEENKIKKGKMKLVNKKESDNTTTDEHNTSQYPSNRNLDQTGIETQKQTTLTINTDNGNGESNQKENYQFINHKGGTNSIMNKIHRFLSFKTKKIINYIFLGISIILFCLSVFEIFSNVLLMNTIFFLIPAVLTVITALFLSILIISSAKKKRNQILLIVLDILLVVLLFNHILTVLTQMEDIYYLLSNSAYCLIMVITLVATLCKINTAIKTQKNVIQNIEEIINFTEMNEEKKSRQTALSIIEDNQDKKGTLDLIEEANKKKENEKKDKDA